jgi:hypothetical protein
MGSENLSQDRLNLFGEPVSICEIDILRSKEREVAEPIP